MLETGGLSEAVGPGESPYLKTWKWLGALELYTWADHLGFRSKKDLMCKGTEDPNNVVLLASRERCKSLTNEWGSKGPCNHFSRPDSGVQDPCMGSPLRLLICGILAERRFQTSAAANLHMCWGLVNGTGGLRKFKGRTGYPTSPQQTLPASQCLENPGRPKIW